MRDVLTPPVSRDVPDSVCNRMRAEVMRTVDSGAATKTPGWRVVLPVTALAVAAALAVPWMSGSGSTSGGGEVLAFGAGDVSARLQKAIAECEHDAYGEHVGMPKGSLHLVNRGEVSRGATGDYTLVVLMDDTDRLVVCGWSENGGSGSFDPAQGNMWLPGPISVDSLTASELNGGDVSVVGRVSTRVAKVVLDHGNGDTTVARLDHGTYAAATGTGGVVLGSAKVIAYDRAGKVISEKPLMLSAGYGVPGCYVDDAGNVVYGTGSNCQPAERWMVAPAVTKSPTA
jgi:hypothetical protein